MLQHTVQALSIAQERGSVSTRGARARDFLHINTHIAARHENDAIKQQIPHCPEKCDEKVRRGQRLSFPDILPAALPAEGGAPQAPRAYENQPTLRSFFQHMPGAAVTAEMLQPVGCQTP